jgi:hypothetical protein
VSTSWRIRPITTATPPLKDSPCRDVGSLLEAMAGAGSLLRNDHLGIDGGIEQSVVQDHMFGGDFDACICSAVEGFSAATSRQTGVEARFTIGPLGQVSGPVRIKTSLGPAAVRCLADVVSHWQFPAGEGSAAIVAHWRLVDPACWPP